MVLSACSAEEKTDKPKLNIKEASFSDLPSWGEDNLIKALPAWKKSCTRILKNDPDKLFGPLEVAGTYKDWKFVCQSINSRSFDNESFQDFLQTYFQPIQILADNNPDGLFTGYYEASLKGSRYKTNQYKYPLHALPQDLVMADLGAFREDLKGRRIAGRIDGNRLKPYESREDIVAGDWPHIDKVLVWVSNPVDAFFLHIQGSGRIQLTQGDVMRVGYAGQNGHPYYAIGRELIKREILEKDEVSMQSIREYLENHPKDAQEIMNTNASYVFFRELDKEGPMGGEGVSLTSLRSLAVDRSLISYGLPLWVDIDEPKQDVGRIRRLMIAQDTGGAIRGPVRGDVFWGYGDKAENMAGAMKSKGRYWALIPKQVLEGGYPRANASK